MDNCKFTRRKLSAHIDGELPPSLAAEVDAHLARCPSCSAYRAELAAISGLLDEAATAPAADGFTAAVIARLKARKTEPMPLRLARRLLEPLPRWAVAAVLLVAIALGSGAAWITGPMPGAAPEGTAYTDAVQQLGLDVFDLLPAETVGGAYLRIAGSHGGEAL